MAASRSECFSVEDTSEVELKPASPGLARVGRVRLAVSDLERSVGFYSQVIGLAVLGRGVSAEGHVSARLGDPEGAELLVLEQVPGVRPISERSRLGLYHTAFLLPSRLDLAQFVAHLRRLGVGFAAGDHLVSEAIYLVDPDGLEVEVYADRPRESWQFTGRQVRMGTGAVRFRELAALVSGSESASGLEAVWLGAPAETTVGHVHFYVEDLPRAAAFYVDGLAMDVMVGIPTALFVSYDGYHHHVGLNVWAAGSPLAGAEDARLLDWELVLPGSVDRVAERLAAAGYAGTVGADGSRAYTDDSGIRVVLVAG